MGKVYEGERVSSLAITIIGVSFIFLMSTLGGSVVFLFRKDLSGKTNSIFLGFASGIMIASSIWSLLLPAIEQSENLGVLNFLPAAVGILLGTLFLVLMDKLVPKLLNKRADEYSQPFKLFLAVTLHNIPEGLAVGLAFGNAYVSGGMSVFYSALWLAIGIGIQNFPESSAISLPLKDKLKSNTKAFFYSVLSGAVEPVMAVLGILLSKFFSYLMPWLLAFSAGCMLFVVAEELIPEAKASHPSTASGWGLIIGFVVMMILDVALG